MPEEVFHVVAEDPEKKHVPGDMQPVGGEKHARDQWQERNFESGMTCQEGRDSRGHHAVRQKKRIGAALRKRRLQADLVNENRDVAENERDVDEGIGARWVEVLKRDEHGKRSAAGYRNAREMKRARKHFPASDNVSVEEPLVNRINSVRNRHVAQCLSCPARRKWLNCGRQFSIALWLPAGFAAKFSTGTLREECACGNYNSSACARVSDKVLLFVRRSVGAPTAHACAGNGSHHSEDIPPGRSGPPGEFFWAHFRAGAWCSCWRAAAEEPLWLDARDPVSRPDLVR